MVAKSQPIREDELNINVVLPVSKIEMYNDLITIQNNALWMLSEAEKSAKKYPKSKNCQASYGNTLKHVNLVNESLQRVRMEIRDNLRSQIRAELWVFIPMF